LGMATFSHSASAAEDRAAVNSGAQPVVKVEGSGRLTADFRNVPPGATVQLEGSG
jgi:hypothetical protein